MVEVQLKARSHSVNPLAAESKGAFSFKERLSSLKFITQTRQHASQLFILLR